MMICDALRHFKMQRDPRHILLPLMPGLIADKKRHVVVDVYHGSEVVL